jgi:hypothetical protein
MGKAAFFIVFIWSAVATAKPLDVYGQWRFRGEIEPSFTKTLVLLPMRSEKDSSRLTELKSQGFTCVYADRNLYRCVKMTQEKWTPSPAHRDKVAALLKGKDFEIEKDPGEPQIITSGDSAVQWSYPGRVYNARGKTDSVIYWELDGGLNKLQFEIKREPFWPFFTSADKMNLVVTVTETEQMKRTQFYYDAIFTKE